MRPTLLLFMFLLFAPAMSHNRDVYLEGNVVDLRTGRPIAFAELEVIDELDSEYKGRTVSQVNGSYNFQLYGGRAAEGGKYRMEFRAEGYGSRQAILDLSAMGNGKNSDAIWRITLNVQLELDKETPAVLNNLIGACAWDPVKKAIACRSGNGDPGIVVRKQAAKNWDVHAALLNSLSDIPGVLVDGLVTDHWSGKVLEGSDIRVETLDGVPCSSDKVTTDKFGYYALVLPSDGAYAIHYSRSGMIGKRVRIVTSGIPDEVRVEGFRASVDIRLFLPIADADLGFLEEPLGVMRYNPDSGNMDWDMAISAPLLRRLESVLEGYNPNRAKRK